MSLACLNWHEIITRVVHTVLHHAEIQEIMSWKRGQLEHNVLNFSIQQKMSCYIYVSRHTSACSLNVTWRYVFIGLQQWMIMTQNATLPQHKKASNQHGGYWLFCTVYSIIDDVHVV